MTYTYRETRAHLKVAEAAAVVAAAALAQRVGLVPAEPAVAADERERREAAEQNAGDRCADRRRNLDCGVVAAAIAAFHDEHHRGAFRRRLHTASATSVTAAQHLHQGEAHVGPAMPGVARYGSVGFGDQILEL